MADPLILSENRLSLVMESLVTSWDAFTCILAEEVHKRDNDNLDHLVRHVDIIDDGIMGMMESFEHYILKGI